MYVCLCTGVTSHQVADAVALGASTCKEVAQLCGAGSDCGRCRRTVRAIIAAGVSADCAGCERQNRVAVSAYIAGPTALLESR